MYVGGVSAAKRRKIDYYSVHNSQYGVHCCFSEVQIMQWKALAQRNGTNIPSCASTIPDLKLSARESQVTCNVASPVLHFLAQQTS